MRDTATEEGPYFPLSSPSLNGEPGPLPNCTSADELLDYVAFLENELESLKLHSNASQAKHQEEKSRLLERLEVALDKMDQAEGELQAHKESDALTQSTVERLKDEFRRTDHLLQEERRKEKNLEDRIQKLELELEMKNDLINHRRKRDEKARRHLEKENEILKKKATLGWMLGCLSEVYFQSEPEGAAAPLLKMVRNIQRELERENVVLSYSNEPPQMQLEYVEKEIRRLIDCARLADSEAEPSTGKASDQTQLVKSMPSTQRSLLEDNDGAVDSGAKTMACDVEDNANAKPVGRVVISKPQETHSPNSRVHEECSSPSARYIINCFGGDAVRSMGETGNNRVASDNKDNAQLEMFEANPVADVEHTRLSGSTWAEVKVMNKRGAEAAEMLHCQSDIKRMLSRLESSMEHLLQQQQLPQQPQQSPQVQDRSLSDFDSMLLGSYGCKTKSKGAKAVMGAHCSTSSKHGSATKHKAPTSKLRSSTKQ
ncbi:hypothetical protein GOP47_0008380 [Adiantum capillus-veneris]|uniref:Uncharacterized protein n=1 Tax=Adiantum capillus-veneris TaxID=13818 RepID=A0A9D4ZKM8_ADICA|nr:hypothetical protein GOP47_0008380 [Adiantum capillus-veneris]